MREHEAVRRLVKSAPELWAVCSDPSLLAKHLGAFGDITITRLEPESTVAWEGEAVSGTVYIEPAGWGTKVTLTATTAAGESAIAPEPVAAPEPPAASEPGEPVAVPDAPAPRGLVGMITSLLRGSRAPAVLDATVAVAEPALDAVAVVESRSEPVAGAGDVEAALEAVLESLGQAHHRPYSRS